MGLVAIVAFLAETLPVSTSTTGPIETVAATTSYPTTPPAAICGNTAMLNGPSTPPAGSVRVDPGTNLNDVTQAQPAGTTFWLAPGTHTFGPGIFAQVIPKNNNVYVGAPGAIIDGRNDNKAAFTQQATGVAIRYLTIQNFGVTGGTGNEGVVNQGSAEGWTIEYNTIRNNAGAGLFVGSNNVIRYNCLADNGQYGFSMARAQVPGGSSITNITIDHNEISGNNTDDWEVRSPGCGCSGAGKFWDVAGAVVTNNWVHHNKGPGLWADTNDIGFLIEGNYINDNNAEGIFYEISYNAAIRNNTLKRNTLVKGKSFADRGDSFPIGSIYLSEAGGDARVNGGTYATLEVTGNYLEDNWGGVVLWENADRFCGSTANTSGGYCTKGGAASLQTCVAGTINNAPYYSDCRWKTQNVSVTDNDFRFSKAAIGCTGTFCGRQALISNRGSTPSWSPYQGTVIQEAVTFNQNNRFAANRYVGEWGFTPYEPSRIVDFAAWQAAPYNQDAGSTLNGTPPPTTTTTARPSTTTTTAPPPTTTTTARPSTTTTTAPPPTTTPPAPPGNLLDANTSGLEGNLGQWVNWYSTNVSRSTLQAQAGQASLRANITISNGWGVTLSNWPGFAATPGNYTIGFSALLGSGDNLDAALRVRWRDGSNTTLRTDVVTIPRLTTTWQRATASATAPAGTTRVWVELVGRAAAGDFLYMDEMSIAPSGTSGIT